MTFSDFFESEKGFKGQDIDEETYTTTFNSIDSTGRGHITFSEYVNYQENFIDIIIMP